MADICTALALGPAPAEAPSRKAMLAVPPPNSGAVGAVATVKTVVLAMVNPWLALRSTVFGSVNIAWVMVPAAMNLVRSCGSLGVALYFRVSPSFNDFVRIIRMIVELKLLAFPSQI